MSAGNTFEAACIALYFNNTSHANVGTATGIVGSTAAGVFWISLHTADPGEGGGQDTNESAYTGYTRVSTARSSTSWTCSGSQASNAETVTFPACTGTSSSVGYFAIGGSSSGAGNLFFSGALTANRDITNGVTPSFAAAALTVSAD